MFSVFKEATTVTVFFLNLKNTAKGIVMQVKIAILYICTGSYHVFWQNFYESAETYFLPGALKNYFVFSDADASLFAQPEITLVHQERLGWPHDTLKRFHMFLRVERQLRSYDYIFFFNANVQFQSPIGEEMLPSTEEGLVVVQHPGYFASPSCDLPYDRNPKSLASIPMGCGRVYVMGGVNGGCGDAYLDLINDLAWAVDKDLERGVIALWHDESHLNRYVLNRKHKLLPPSYGFPEGSAIPYDNIITIIDKNNWGGHEFLRNAKNPVASAPRPSFFEKINHKLRRTAAKCHLWH